MEEKNDKISKSSFVYYLDWAEELLKYPDDLRLKIDDAIKKYVLYKEEPTDRDVIFSIFGIIRKQLDRDLDKYLNKCKKNAENVRKRWEEYKRIQTNTTVYDSIRPDTNYTDNGNGNDNEILLLDKSNNRSGAETPDSKEPKKEKESNKKAKPSEINYDALINFFNTQMEKEGATISRIRNITERRKKTINARCREYGKEAIFTVIVNASKSNFLNGKNTRSWIAEFDWIFLPNNFAKVLEGNYNNQNTDNGNNRHNNNSPQKRNRTQNQEEPGFGLVD